ncbi:hypothetical protein ABT317_32060, partial [Streptomyces carpinensis]
MDKVSPLVVEVAWPMPLCGGGTQLIHGQFGEGGLVIMTQWTSAVGAAQLARLLGSQQERPAGP